MSIPLAHPAAAEPIDGEDELMARYAITRVPAFRFHYENYRYTSLNDAVAQARRDERRR